MPTNYLLSQSDLDALEAIYSGAAAAPINGITISAVVHDLLLARREAEANAEKAALLDWLDHTRPSLSFGYSPEYPLGAWGIYWTNAQTEQVEDAEAERLPDALRAAREASDD